MAAHGTIACYWRFEHTGCRCDPCRRAALEYWRMWRAARTVAAGGLPGTWVRATPALVAHLEALKADGWSQRAIARTAGVSNHTVAQALAGGRLYWRTAHALRSISR